MLPDQINRWGGAALVLGSVLFILNKFNDISRVFLNRPFPDLITGQSVFLIAAGQLGLVLGLICFYALYAEKSNRPGKIGLLLLAGGGVLVALGHIVFTPFAPTELLFVLVLLGVLGMVAGLILFGVVNLRHPVLAYWQALPLVSGLLGGVGFFLSGGSENPIVFLPLRTVFGLSLMLLGVVMWRDSERFIVQPAKNLYTVTTK